MSKTLGQINYERFTPEWVTPLVPWHEVAAQEQQRWEAAAQAVWRHVVLNEKCIHAPKREAVIEAARELVHNKPRTGIFGERLAALWDALEALKAEEDSDYKAIIR